MSAGEFALLVLAGVGAGLTGSIAGLASLISYPALLAVGIPPVTANVTNTVALVLNSVGSVSASRPELTAQGRRLRRLAVTAVLGGGAGMALLPLPPPGGLARIAPWAPRGAPSRGSTPGSSAARRRRCSSSDRRASSPPRRPPIGIRGATRGGWP